MLHVKVIQNFSAFFEPGPLQLRARAAYAVKLMRSTFYLNFNFIFLIELAVIFSINCL